MEYILKSKKSSVKNEIEPIDDYERMVYLPVSEEMVEAVKIGAKVEITLVGEVKSLNQREYGNNMDVKVSKIVLPEKKNKFTELVEEEGE